jgi:hypothetical protein
MRPSRPAIAVCLAAILAVGLTFALFGQRSSKTLTATFDPPYPEFNAKGDPIQSVMEGRVACQATGCDKLKVTLVLYAKAQDRSPSSYWLGIIGTSGNDRVVSQGAWEMRKGVEGYLEAAVYALDSDAGLGLQYFWRVNDDILLVLDERMRPRSGDSAWGYMLSRLEAPYGPRTYTWTQ